MKSEIKFLRLTIYGPWATPCQEATPTPSILLVFSLLEVLRFGLCLNLHECSGSKTEPGFDAQKWRKKKQYSSNFHIKNATWSPQLSVRTPRLKKYGTVFRNFFFLGSIFRFLDTEPQTRLYPDTNPKRCYARYCHFWTEKNASSFNVLWKSQV